MRSTVETVLAETTRTADVQAAAATGLLNSRGVSVTSVDRPSTSASLADFAELISGTNGLFGALDLPLLAGRRFDDRDGPAAAPVAIVNQTLARKLFGHAPAAIDHEVWIRDYTGRISTPAEQRDGHAVTVVGVAMDTTIDRQGRPDPVIYRPFAQTSDLDDVAFVARSPAIDSASLVSLLRTVLRRADNDIAIRYAGNAQMRFQIQTIALGVATAVIATLAAIALVLAMAGLYGVLSFVVYHRTREIGVRMALGASGGGIVRLVVRDGLRPVAEGLFIGLGAAFAIRALVQSSLTQPLSGIDPIAIVVSIIPLLIAAAIACYIPARRAAKVDPNVALREM